MKSNQERKNEMLKFKKYMENVLFNQTRLNKLKQFIKQICSDKVDDRIIREYILKERIHMLQKLIELIPYFIRTERNNISFQTNMNEIEEKDKLLEQIGKRINTIYTKLQKSS